MALSIGGGSAAADTSRAPAGEPSASRQGRLRTDRRLAGPTGPPGRSARGTGYQPERRLRAGARGPAQPRGSSATGRAPSTASSVRGPSESVVRFQRDESLPADAIVGPHTLHRLRAEIARPQPPRPAAPPPARPAPRAAPRHVAPAPRDVPSVREMPGRPCRGRRLPPRSCSSALPAPARWPRPRRGSAARRRRVRPQRPPPSPRRLRLFSRAHRPPEPQTPTGAASATCSARKARSAGRSSPRHWTDRPGAEAGSARSSSRTASSPWRP